jgi:pSer/pThr/pTyr-binding forkhead associated (FHA) protein
MDLIKRCPACNEENPVSEVVCRVCMTNIAQVSPVGRNSVLSDTPSPDGVSERTIFEPSAVLTLSRISDGCTIAAASGDMLGRSGNAAEFFKDARTVSRSHARLDFHDGTWRIEDLDSTNGTRINGRRIERGTAYPLKVGDVLSLSLACEMKVMG